MLALFIPLVLVIKSLLPRLSACNKYLTFEKNSIFSQAKSAPIPPTSSWTVKHILISGNASSNCSAQQIPFESSAFNPHCKPDLIYLAVIMPLLKTSSRLPENEFTPSRWATMHG